MDISGTIAAAYNRWDDPGGSTRAGNPDGKGVEVSDRVIFTPWLTGTPAGCPVEPVLGTSVFFTYQEFNHFLGRTSKIFRRAQPRAESGAQPFGWVMPYELIQNPFYAIILSMRLKDLMQVYQAGWKAVEEVQTEERRFASLEFRWRQLNAAYGLAKGLGILQPDSTEEEVIKRWAILKDKTIRQNPKA